MADIEAIIQALQAELIRQDRDQVEPVEAEEWLANKGLLKVHPTKAGKNVRDLLRDGLLSGHQAPDRRWVIELTDLQNVVAPQYHFDVERPHTWVVRAGKGGKLAEEFRGRGCIAIGYRPTPDLTGLSAEEVADSVRDAFSDQPEGKIKNFTHQLQAFSLGIRPDDLVLTPSNTHTDVFVGRVTGPYEFLKEPLITTFNHYHRVQWLQTVKRSSLPAETQRSLGARITVFWAGAVDKLRKRFPIENDPSGDTAPTASAWIFQGSPKIFDVHAAVKNLREQEWTVRQHRSDIHIGHRVYLWVAGPEAGLIGVGEIADEISERASTDDSYVIDRETLGVVEPRVAVTNVRPLKETVRRDALLKIPELSQLSVLVARQGTNFKVTPEQDTILWRLVGPLLPGNRDLLAPPKWTNAWWVNQGATFKEESDGGYVWAPNTSKGGGTPKKHWQALTGMKVGDLIFHYPRAAIRAVSRVTELAEVTDRPSELPLTEWEGQGWKVKTDYFHLDEPISLSEIPQEWRLTEGGAFDVNGAVKQQYANHVSEHFTNLLIDRFGDRIRNATSTESTPFPGGDALDTRLLDLIERRMNIVFYGPPGTGKTFAALELSKQWEQKHGPGSVRKVTFHPSYGYEDFVQGFRPKSDQPGEFALQPGILLRICDEARKDPDRKFLLFIDEINRGDVARIFGELITYIERDKRDVPFDLAQDATAQYEILRDT